jgi:general secretion pathway protein B
MSFILDALRKSEIERQRQNGPSIVEIPVAREDRRLPIALVAIGLLLAVNVGVLLFFLLRDSGSPAVEATPAVAVVAPPAVATPAPLPPGVPPAAMDPAFGPSALPGLAFEEPATLPPDAPDPTLLPDAPIDPGDAGVTYSPGPQVVESLPRQAAAGLPALSVDLHIFSDEPAKRAVFINGRRYTQGDRIIEGPMVEEITPEGAVLRHRGQRFLLPRL